MLKKIALALIAGTFVLSSGVVIGAKYGPTWQRHLAHMERHSALVDSALRAEQRECELQALDVQLPRTSLQPVYAVPNWSEPGFWFYDARFACEGQDLYGRPVQVHTERPTCNRAEIEREWLQGGTFAVPLRAACGIEH